MVIQRCGHILRILLGRSATDEDKLDLAGVRITSRILVGFGGLLLFNDSITDCQRMDAWGEMSGQIPNPGNRAVALKRHKN